VDSAISQIRQIGHRTLLTKIDIKTAAAAHLKKLSYFTPLTKDFHSGCTSLPPTGMGSVFWTAPYMATTFSQVPQVAGVVEQCLMLNGCIWPS